MDNKVAKVPLRGVWALLNEAWQLYTGRFLSLAAAVLIPATFTLLLFTLPLLLLPRLAGGGALVVAILATALGVLGAYVGNLAAIIVLMEGVGVAEAYRRVPGRFAGYLWILLLQTSALMGGTLLGIVPGLILSVQLSFVSYVFLGERRGGVGALARSREYVAGYWWATLGRMFGMGFILAIPLIIGYLALALVLAAVNNLIFGGSSAMDQIFALPAAVLGPLFLALPYVVYRNLKELKPDLAAREPQGSRAWLVVCAVIGGVALAGVFAANMYNSSSRGAPAAESRLTAGEGGGLLSALTGQDALIRQAQNGKRATDIDILDNALKFFIFESDEGVVCGSRNVSTSNSGSRAVDGTGWLPVDFTAGMRGLGAPFLELPSDSVNEVPYVYSYACDPATARYELNAVFDPRASSYTSYENKARTDGGSNPNVYEVGSDLTLIP